MFIIQTLSSQLVGGALLLSKNSACWDQKLCVVLMHTHDSCQKMCVSWDLVLTYNGPKKLSLDIHFHQQKYTCFEKVLFRMRKIRQLFIALSLPSIVLHDTRWCWEIKILLTTPSPSPPLSLWKSGWLYLSCSPLLPAIHHFLAQKVPVGISQRVPVTFLRPTL